MSKIEKTFLITIFIILFAFTSCYAIDEQQFGNSSVPSNPSEDQTLSINTDLINDNSISNPNEESGTQTISTDSQIPITNTETPETNTSETSTTVSSVSSVSNNSPISNILNIALIVVGILLVLLSIAILIRLH